VRFNPRPAVRPGDTIKPEHCALLLGCFNPRPAVRPGDTKDALGIVTVEVCFNPRPAVRPGDTARSQLIELIANVGMIARTPFHGNTILVSLYVIKPASTLKCGFQDCAKATR